MSQRLLFPVVCILLSQAFTASAQPDARTDLYGDPLPDGALARFGSARLRHAGLSDYVLLPDGRSVLTAGGDRMLRFWDLASGRPTRAVQVQIKAGFTRGATLSPDGKTLLAQVGTQFVFWEVDSGKEIKAISAPKQNAYYSVFSPDGKTLAMGWSDWRVSFLDWQSGKERESPLPFHPRPIRQFSGDSTFHGSFSPDGNWFVASAAWQEPVGVFEVATGREVHRLDAFALTSRVSPDSRRLAVVSRQNDKGEAQTVIRLFDLRSGKETAQVPLGTDEHYYSLAFSPNGNILACGFSDRSCLLDLTTGRVLHRLPGRPIAPAFSRDGKTLIASTGQRLRRWDVATGKEFDERPGDFGYNPVLAVSPDGRRLASGDWMEQVVSIWDTADGRLLHRLPLKGQGRYVRSLDFSDDSRTVVAGQGMGFLQWWDVANGKEQRTLQLQEVDAATKGEFYFYHLRVDGDGKRVSSLDRFFGPTGEMTRLAVWDAGSGKPLVRHALPTDSRHVTWLAGGKSAVIPVADGLTMMDLPSGVMRLRFLGTAADRPLVVSPDSRLLASRKETADGKHKAGLIVVWETATGKEVATVATEGFGQMALMPGNRRVVTTEYGVVCVRDLGTGKVQHRWPLPDGEIGSRNITWVPVMILSPDGRRAFTVIADGTAFVWDLTPGLRHSEPPVRDLDTKELAAGWADLAGEDAAKAQRAVWALADAPKQAVPFLGGRLKPIVGPDEKKVRRWIADLDSDDFQTRQTALQELAPLAELITPLVKEVLRGDVSLEVRRRLEQLFEKSASNPSTADELRRLRGVQALELMKTAEARALLVELAKGAAGARQTREARDALDRLVKRQ